MDWAIDKFEEISSFWELRDFCEEYEVYPDDIDFDNLVDSDYISEQIQDMARRYRWDDITDALRDLDWNGDNGEEFEWGDYVRELTSEDLETCKEQVLSALHEEGRHLEGEDGYDDPDESSDEEDEEEDVQWCEYVDGSHVRGLYGGVTMDGCLQERRMKCSFHDDDLMAIIQGR